MGGEIAFIGTRDTWARWRSLFNDKGFSLHLVEGFDALPIEDLDDRISSIIGRRYSSAIFTSKNAVKILMSSDIGRGFVENLYREGSLLVSIGEGTAEILKSHGYRSFTPPIERISIAVSIIGSAIRPGGRIAVLSSDKLDLGFGGALEGIEIDHIKIYRLVMREESIEMIRHLVERGVRSFIVASQTASELLAEAMARGYRDGLDTAIEAHAMSSRIARPLIEKGLGDRVRVIVYESPTFRGFMLSIIERISGHS
ncbi:MAG: uroporphyrinogen-III synthase [Sulfolobales archaeon]